MTTMLLTTKAIDLNIDPIDWPRCAVCHMPVEDFRATDTGDSIIFVTECHGEYELATIPDDVWDTAMGTHVTLGQAFQRKGEHYETTLD